jgi:D-glycero-D-manno-heptose 1,7-bisphosphate phosphatase
MNRAVFVDRDGVINRKPAENQYVTSWEEMHFLPNVATAISLLNRAGFRVIVVTNQRCVAKGLIPATDLEAMHQRMRAELAADGAQIDDIYYCPHEHYPPCSCRKPKPGMLVSAARAYALDLGASWIIGDSETDVQAGKNAGCRTARVLGNDESASHSSDVVGASLLDAVHKVLQWEQRRKDLGNFGIEEEVRH